MSGYSSHVLAEALAVLLLRRGMIDAVDIDEMAGLLEAMGEPDAARICRAALVRSIEAPMPAVLARAQLRIVE